MNSARLCDVASVFNGRTPARTEQRTAGHPVLKVKDIDSVGVFSGTFESFVQQDLADKYRDRWAVPGDTVILNAAHQTSHVASKVAILDSATAGALVTGEWLIVRPSGEVHPEYLHYWLTSQAVRRSLKEMVKGIHLYPKDVAALNIQLPRPDEQRRIAAILDHADTVRAARRKSITEYASLINAIFVHMFGDPDDAIKSGNSIRLGDVADLQGGRNLVAEDEAAASEFRVLKISAVTSGQFKASECKPLPLGYLPPVEHLVPFSVLVERRA